MCARRAVHIFVCDMRHGRQSAAVVCTRRERFFLFLLVGASVFRLSLRLSQSRRRLRVVVVRLSTVRVHVREIPGGDRRYENRLRPRRYGV